MGDWTVRAVIRVPGGIIAVRKPGSFWHLPGGKREPEHTRWRDTAFDEVLDETGIRVKRFERLVTKRNRQGKKGRYAVIYCEAHMPHQEALAQLVPLDPRREEQEEASVLSLETIAALGPDEFHAAHKSFLLKRGLLETGTPAP